MRTDIDPGDSAKEYESILKGYFPQAASEDLSHHSPLTAHASKSSTFDLVLLGLGDNAHTLSLFPGEAVVHEKNHWVRSVFVKEINMQRITLTAPVVNLSGRIAFLVSGQDKAEAVAHILSDNYNPDLYPAQVIKPVHGELFWFLDATAMMIRK